MFDRLLSNARLGRSMAEDRTGASFGQGNTATVVIGLVVALTVGALVAAFLLPIAIEELSTAELGENASSGADALWGILDVMIVLAVFLFFTGIAIAATERV